jgi:hypothetical protein
MPIPAFGNDGLLPPGRQFAEWEEQPIHWGHSCSLDELQLSLVQAFPQSTTRPALYNEICRLIDFVRNHVRCFEIFVSGEFVTSYPDAANAYIVLQTTSAEIDKLTQAERWFVWRFFLDQEYTWGESTNLTVQTGLSITYPSDHYKHLESQTVALLLRCLLSQPVPDTDPHGYLELIECDEEVDNNEQIEVAPSSRN